MIRAPGPSAPRLRPPALMLSAIAVLALCGCPPLVISGTVESVDGVPIAGAEIRDMYNTNHVAESNDYGEFAIQARRKNVGGETQALIRVRVRVRMRVRTRVLNRLRAPSRRLRVRRFS